MEWTLNPIEARILGVLMEKEMTTPDYYPMTLNALINACNQKSNRNPVMALDEEAVADEMDRLRRLRLVFQVKAQGSRALKYEHNMGAIAEFSREELAVLCELLLRGPQTSGELRLRTARMVEIPTLSAMERILERLSAHEQGPFLTQLARRPGHKESRYMHLFFEGDPEEAAPPEVAGEADGACGGRGEDRLSALEARVAALETELADLKARFAAFARQFE